MRALVLLCSSLLSFAACGGESGDPGAGNGGRTATGGASAASGGAKITGGAPSTGGSVVSGGRATSGAGGSSGRPGGGGSTSGGAVNSVGGATSGGTSTTGGTGGGAGDLVDCDLRKVTCRRARPECPAFEVPTVEGTCYGACVRIESCACSTAEECPDNNEYTCWRRMHCGPYI